MFFRKKILVSRLGKFFLVSKIKNKDEFIEFKLLSSFKKNLKLILNL